MKINHAKIDLLTNRTCISDTKLADTYDNLVPIKSTVNYILIFHQYACADICFVYRYRLFKWFPVDDVDIHTYVFK